MKLTPSILFFVIALGTYASAVRIGSFNLHQYGSKKSANKTLTNTVAQIINEFDLAIIQEISDASLKAPYVLHEALNAISTDGDYTMTLSPRVGRSATKEQYIFFNRASTSGLEVVDAYIYEDPEDIFERPPFVGTFKVKKPGKSGIKSFTVMDVHLRPDDAYAELLGMRNVIEDFIQRNPKHFGEALLEDILEQNVINATAENKPSLNTNHPILIVGDFNADCTYISARRQALLRSIHFVDFTWVINNEVKTNTRETCTYDRILINGDNFVNAIVPESNSTLNYRERFNMSLDQALGVSDHMPIKFEIEW